MYGSSKLVALVSILSWNAAVSALEKSLHFEWCLRTCRQILSRNKIAELNTNSWGVVTYEAVTILKDCEATAISIL